MILLESIFLLHVVCEILAIGLCGTKIVKSPTIEYVVRNEVTIYLGRNNLAVINLAILVNEERIELHADLYLRIQRHPGYITFTLVAFLAFTSDCYARFFNLLYRQVKVAHLYGLAFEVGIREVAQRLVFDSVSSTRMTIGETLGQRGDVSNVDKVSNVLSYLYAIFSERIAHRHAQPNTGRTTDYLLQFFPYNGIREFCYIFLHIERLACFKCLFRLACKPLPRLYLIF